MPGAGGGGSGELVFNGYTLSDGNIPEMDGGDGCTTVRMYLMSLNCTPKNKAAHFMLYTFYHNKKAGGGEGEGGESKGKNLFSRHLPSTTLCSAQGWMLRKQRNWTQPCQGAHI